jgi:hypothetical protein
MPKQKIDKYERKTKDWLNGHNRCDYTQRGSMLVHISSWHDRLELDQKHRCWVSEHYRKGGPFDCIIVITTNAVDRVTRPANGSGGCWRVFRDMEREVSTALDDSKFEVLYGSEWLTKNIPK